MSTDLFWILCLAVGLLGGIMSGVPVMLAISGIPVAIGIIAALFGHFDLVYFQAIPQRVFGIMENPLLLAVPLFIAMGVLLDRSQQAERMLDSINRLFGGGRVVLALSVLIVSTLIAASTGVIGATIVMLGTISLPTLLRAGVDKHTATGLICASGTLGQIIPPSIVLILLGDQVSNAYIEAQQAAGNFAPDPVTVGDLFAGALFPGLLLVALYGIYVFFRLRGQDRERPAPVETGPVPGAGGLILDILPTFSLICAVLGSILAGVATPTEAAGIGVAGTILIAGAKHSRVHAGVAIATAVFALGLLVLRRFDLIGATFEAGRITWTGQTIVTLALMAVLIAGVGFTATGLHRNRVLVPAMTETLVVSGMVFGIIVAASVLALVFRGFEGDVIIEEFLTGLPGGVWGMLAITMLVVFLLGFVLEFVEIIFIVIPIVGPVILQSDISPVWFAVLIAMNLQTSFITPPFGFALFYFRSVAPPEITGMTIYRAIIPFVALQLAAIAVLVMFPGLATWLPNAIF